MKKLILNNIMEINESIILHPSFIKTKKKQQKVFVFDFDETLGSFGHVYYLWNAIIKTIHNVSFDSFKNVMDLYPEFLRYGILVILEFIYYKKIKGKCHKIFIYTNNLCGSNWVNMIIRYISLKIPIINNDIPLFDKIVCAFKINGRIIETQRTTNKKTYQDFINCTILSKNTEICFIDDTYHDKMIHNKIYYIQPRPYNHNLSKNTILSRLFDNIKKWDSKKTEIINNFNLNRLDYYIKSENDKKNDIFISQKMMYLIKEFFYISSINTTLKKNKRWGKFTRKTKLKMSIHYNNELLEQSIGS
jgi:hypothetical protein